MRSRLCVSRWLKVMMYVVASAPAATAFAGLVPHGSWPGKDPWLIALGFATLVGASLWLFSRVHFLNSIVLGDDGVEQSFLGFRGASHVHLDWDQVVRVSFSEASFHFTGVNGGRLELNTFLFNDMQQTIRTVHERLPARLRAQLDAMG